MECALELPSHIKAKDKEKKELPLEFTHSRPLRQLLFDSFSFLIRSMELSSEFILNGSSCLLFSSETHLTPNSKKSRSQVSSRAYKLISVFSLAGILIIIREPSVV